MALAATQHYYTLSQVSQSVLPSLCGLTCDPEREVRDQAFKVIKGFLSKLEKVSEDPSLKESMGTIKRKANISSFQRFACCMFDFASMIYYFLGGN